MEHASLKVNPGSVRSRAKMSRAYRTCSRARVEGHENKSRHVLPAGSSCGVSFLDFSVSPGGPDEAGGFRTSEPPISRLASFWQKDRYNLPAESFSAMMSDGRTQIFQFSSGRCGRPSIVSVTTTVRSRDIAQPLVVPKLRERLDAHSEFMWAGLLCRLIVHVDSQHV
jgi:hypothetical protein